MPKQVVPEAARRRRRPTRQGTVLSETLIVHAALRVLREHGRAGLTARRLGTALGADPSTLYRYFTGMDDLARAIGDEFMGRALDSWTSVGNWRADLRALGLAIHSCYLTHPQAAVLAASRVSGRPREIALDETILAILRGTGLPDASAVRFYHAFIDLALAFAALDAASLALPAQARATDKDTWDSVYARLPAASHPNIAATAGLLVAQMRHSAYPLALGSLLDSIASELPAVAILGQTTVP